MSIQPPVDPEDRSWALKQRHITDASTALTAAGAVGLGAMLAGKTKSAKKVLPKGVHRKLQSGKADDLRNTIALASMVGGVASGAHWSKKLKRDAEKPVTPQEAAANLATASKADIEKAIVAAGVGRSPTGKLFMRNATIRRPRNPGGWGYNRIRLPRPGRL